MEEKPCVFQVVREVQMRIMLHCVFQKEVNVSQATDKYTPHKYLAYGENQIIY